MERDYYEVLGVPRDASDHDIKKAYRRLAMKYHPDRNTDNPAAEAKFKEAKQAYDILSDSQKRNAYNQFGHAGVGDNSGGAGFDSGGFSDIFESVFGDIFGGGQGRGHHSGGSDLQYDLEISLEQAALGAVVSLDIPKQIICRNCHGSGAKPGTSPQICSRCNGEGQIRMQQGFFSLQQTCPTCRGKGRSIHDPCLSCHGQGRVRENKTISVKISEGVDSGDRIRLSSEGDVSGHGGEDGDLYIHITIKPHAIFSRDGVDLHCEVPISFTTAALGGEAEVPTFENLIKLKIPSGTQSGKVFRLRGKGIKSIRTPTKGDLLCRVYVETPVKLTSRQRELLEEFETNILGNYKKHKPQSDSWVEKIKQFFDSESP